MKATHIYTEGLTNRQLANRALKAMSLISDADNGTIRNPYELASVCLQDGRSIIQTIYEDGGISYNDGYYVVEADGSTLYVDLTCKAMKEWGISTDEYDIIDEVN